MKPKRPNPVTLLVFYVLTLAAVNITKTTAAIQQWKFLNSLPLSFSPLWTGITGMGWGLLWLWLALRLWTGQPKTPKAVKITAVGYFTYLWIDQIFLMVNPLRKVNWPFQITASLGMLLLIYWILSLSKARNFFGEKYVRERQD